jgi:hypothetical protein
MPVYLFNDLFAYTTIDISERIFVVMEEKASIWRSVCWRISMDSVEMILFILANLLSICEKCTFKNVQR